MGLFDFVINQGKKLFGAGDDPAEKIKQEIEAANPGIKNLNVEFKDGEVKLSGEAASAEAMEKAVLMAGNVQGVAKVSADQVQAPPQADKVEYYTIQSGDSPTKVANKYGITMQQLGAANVKTRGYKNFVVGVEINIPCDDGTNDG